MKIKLAVFFVIFLALGGSAFAANEHDPTFYAGAYAHPKIPPPQHLGAPIPVVITDVNGNTLAVTGIAGSASGSKTGNPTPVVLTDANGNVLTLSGGGGGAFSAITSGTNTTASMVCGTGCSFGTSGTGANSATALNSTPLAGLGTGLLKNTTGTGVPSIAIAADFPTLNQNTTGTASHANDAYGPVINVTNPVYAGCFATVSTGQDWSACFASVATAASTAFSTTVGTPTIRSVAAAPFATSTSVSATVAISKGDTVLIYIVSTSGRTYTFSDPGGNSFALINPFVTGGQAVYLYGTGPGNALASSGTLTITQSGGATSLGAFIVDAFNVGSFGQTGLTASGSSTGPTVSVTTQDSNNMIVAGFGWYSGGVDTATANAGTLQATSGSTAALGGGAIVTNTSASPAAVTDSITLSVTSPWAVSPIELRSVSVVVPTVYFPAGNYTYSSGLNFTQPVTLKGEPGTWLCYTGTAHAVDMGSVLTSTNYQTLPLTVDSMGFTCGGSMTEGVYFSDWNVHTHVLHSNFLNFGNATAYDVYYHQDNWEALVEFNWFETYDNIKRNMLFVNNSFDGNTQLRFIGNFVSCLNGIFGQAGCGNPGIGVSTGGPGTLVSENNFNFFSPNVIVGGAYTKLLNNYAEPGTNTAVPAFQFTGNVYGLEVGHTYSNLHGNNNLLGPADGASSLIGARIFNNELFNANAAFEVVVLNNLAGQTGNIAHENVCGSTGLPCPILHTAGGSITQWGGDYAGTCTMVSGVCPTYTFLATYALAPKCVASWTGTGTLTAAAGGVTVTSTTSTLIISSKVLTDTAVMNWFCNPDAQ